MIVQSMPTPTLETLFFDVATGSIRGSQTRQHDSVIAHFPLGEMFGYAIIADGFGTDTGGEVASALASAEVFAQLKMQSREVEEGSPNLPLILREAADAANAQLGLQVARDASLRGMGTTLLVPVLSGRQLHWISVGDSRLLLFRSGALRRLNKDHSLKVDVDVDGPLVLSEETTHPERAQLASCLDGTDVEMIDCPSGAVMLAPQDIVIASTDGLTSLSNALIANVLAQAEGKSSAEIVNAFLRALKDLDSPDQDNVAFAVIRVGANVVDPSAVQAEDMPVLAMATQPEETAAAAAEAPAPAPDPTPFAIDSSPVVLKETASPEQVVAQKKVEKKFFWYRGQRYERED